MRLFGKLCFLRQMLIWAEGFISFESPGQGKAHAVEAGRWLR